MPRSILPHLGFATALLASSVAHADLIDPREDACGGKKAGDACEADGEPGTCQTGSCTKNDYSDGTPPKTKSYECLLCQPGGRPDDSESKEAAPVDEPEDKAKPTGSPTPSEASANAEKKGCSVGDSATSAASLGLGLLLLAWVTRRRQDSRSNP